ncbi:helix-turn-helix domain-containing protein [Pseudarcicella hirudinis]
MPYYEGKLELPEYADMKMLEINLTLEFFQRIASEEFPVFKSFFENIRSKSHGILGKHNRTITPRMQWLIKEIVECKQKGYLKRLFLEAKILELFMLQVEMFEEPQLQKQAFIKKKDVDKIVHAQHIILANINTPYSLLELSRQVGINDFKLKRGFKEVFGNTVFGYIHQIRMERAKEKLLQGEMNISEVADYTGYKNRTHFSAAFKKTFGFSPTGLINCKGGIS